MKPWRYIYSYRRLLFGSAFSDLKSRYAGSVVGVGWFFLNPLLFLSFYSVVYLLIFKLRPNGMDQISYVCHILAGILPFLAVSEALSAGTQSISANRDIFKNTVYPPEILVVRTVLTGHSQLIVGLIILLFVSVARSGFHASIVILPLLLCLQILFLTGLCWILSLVNLVFRDLQNIIGFVIMMLMVASPIAYTPEMVPDGLRFLLLLNPIAHFILIYQEVVVHGGFPSVANLSVVAFLSLFFFSFGFFVFSRLKKVVANYA